jgi:RNA polymerase sigma-70 factor (ECF subfamily)
MSPLPLLSDSSVDDPELVHRIASHDEGAFETVMRRYNGALYRVARAILKNTADAEDVLQESHLSAYRHIADFRADAKLSTWLTRYCRQSSSGEAPQPAPHPDCRAF